MQKKQSYASANRKNSAIHAVGEALRRGFVCGLVLVMTLLPAVAGAQHVMVNGSVYGGGALANVEQNTVVSITGGTVVGSVYGGGLGDSIPYGGTQNVAAIVEGDATVNIGDPSQNTPLADGISFNTVHILGNVFGANNLNGTPRGSTEVHIWYTAHTALNAVPTSMTIDDLMTYHEVDRFALREVYGGGNKADYKPGTTGQKAQVYVHGCSNSVKMVYGGGRAAAVGTDDVNSETSVTVEGGRIDTLFAGGDGHTKVDDNYVAADVYGNTNAKVTGGYFTAIFGGSNTSGTISGAKNVDIDHSTCDFELVSALYGGGNLAYGGGGTLTIECGAGEFDEVYGGSNLAPIGGDVVLNIKGGTIRNVYGGSRGSSTVAADITGNVTLNLYGGTITNAFGGSNINGNITGIVTVLVDSTRSDCHPLEVQNVYGASDFAQYLPEGGSTLVSPVVNLVNGTVQQNVYGGGKGRSGNIDAGLVKSSPKVRLAETSVTDKMRVLGNIYGGGELSCVSGSTVVGIGGDGTRESSLVRVGNSVYGGGRGEVADRDAARVSGNATVDMKAGQVVHSIYGGGEMASVGDIKYFGSDEEAETWNDGSLPVFYRSSDNNGAVDADSCRMRKGDAYECTSGGKTTVSISGGIVGDPDNVEHVKMPMHHSSPSDDDYGYVFAACKGILGPEFNNDGTPSNARLLAVSGSSELNISGGLITASVYGGSENGQVLGDTKVSISGGQIGVGYNATTKTADGLYDWTEAFDGTLDTNSNPFHECDASPYNESRIVYDYYATDSVKNGDVWEYLYPNGEMAQQGSATMPSNGHSFFGNVFAGGSGYYAYDPGKWRRTAGRVLGNTVVEITGGHILSGVYGGNEITDVLGSSTVTITGGTVGVPRSINQMRNRPVNSNVYGGGMGDPRTWANQWSNVASANVVIGNEAVIFGSVFGGGEDGHVLGDVKTTIGGDVTLSDGTVVADGGKAVIGTYGSSTYDGNIFGGGRGFSAYALTAGVVRGNVRVDVKSGFIMGSVYGGGRLAAVGTPLVPDPDDVTDEEKKATYAKYYGVMQDGEDHGNITITISGGTIGNEATKTSSTDGIGNVFGGSKGTKALTNEEFNQRLGLSKNTIINISQDEGKTTKIIGNVYGGGELASVGTYVYATQAQADEFNRDHPSYGSNNNYIVHAEDVFNYGDTEDETSGLTKVTVSGGTIGVADEVIDDGTAHRVEGHTKYRTGHVYGAGLGKAGPHYSGYTFVRNTEVTITGSASIVGSVFGGGENGHVWGGTLVKMDGGTVGQEPDATEYEETNGQGTEIYFGNVYGGGRGIDNSGDKLGYSVSAGRVRGDTEVQISGGRVTHNVYGGGSLANTGFPTDDDTKGLAKVTISGGIIGYSDGTDDPTNPTYYARAGKNGGRVYGSARGLAGSADGTLAHMAFTRQTEVTISGAAKVTGSVFGGGENGHVRQDTKVTIEGGTIGVPLQGADHQESDNGVGPTIYRGNVYGGGRGLDNFKVTDEEGNPVKRVETGHTDEDSVSFSLTAGRVYGNAEIKITNGQIYHHVYGGGSLASVGDTIHDVSGDVAKDILGNTVEGKYEFDTIGGTITRAYHQGDPITGTGTVTINVSGGVIGENGINEGRIYGSGRGIAGSHTSQYTHMAFTHNTVVNIMRGADIRGSVFGGGANGHVTQNTKVNVSGGTIGSRLALEERCINSGGTHKHIYRGNVYGGGRGVDPIDNEGTKLSISAGRVFGNTTVNVTGGTVRHNVYGGGSLASVGSYKEVSDDPSFSEVVNVEEYTGNVVHAYLQGTGKAIVNIKGGRIGPLTTDLLVDDDGNSLVVDTSSDWTVTNQEAINDNFLYLGENEGSVYGSGRGVAYTDVDDNGLYTEVAFVKQTQVNIEGGEVVGSVFGGGENGHVRFDTEVNIKGGRIGGIPLHDEKGFDISKNDFGKLSLTVSFNIPSTAAKYDGTEGRTQGDDKDIAYKNIVELYELYTGVGKTIYRGNVYGGGRGIDHTKDQDKQDYSASAGRVYGNANVNITGGIIYHHVYGGGSIASVGNYETLTDGTPSAPRPQIYGFEFTHEGWSKSNISSEKGVDTVQHGLSGTVTVKVYGGQIGYTGINEGRIYCAGRGIAGKHTWKITHLAYCNKTHLYINDTIIDGVTSSPDIRGSVFGGGANGHVLADTKVEVLGGNIGWGIASGLYASSDWSDDLVVKGLLGYSLEDDMKHYAADEWGTSQTMYRGNVYGGGRGVDPASGTEGTDDSQLSPTAGRVYGNIMLHVGGSAHVLHNVYGGGSLASVGDTLADETESYTLGDGTTVEVGKYKEGTGKATVLVDGDAQIGWNGVDNNGQVYGSCRGMPASVGTNLGRQYIRVAYVHETEVTIDGEAKVLGSVFGGGANGHVQADTKVNIKGGTIGVKPTLASGETSPSVQYDYCGNVYGAGRGVDRTSKGLSMSAGYVRGNTEVNVTGGKIRHNVYGGGSMAVVGDYGIDGNSDDNKNTASSGRAKVNIYSSVGDPDLSVLDNGVQWGGNVFGSSRGQANDYTVAPAEFLDYADMAYVFKTQVTVDNASAIVYGSVYGGGENGHVDYGGTTVDIVNGTVKGSVFGGGKGNPSSPTAGIVDGPTVVNIGSEGETETNNVKIGEYVFGGNDAGSSPLGDMTVNIYHTAHTDGVNNFAYFPTLAAETSVLDSNDLNTLGALSDDVRATHYALKAVYGGSNKANVLTGDISKDFAGYSSLSDAQKAKVNDKYIKLRIDPATNGNPAWPVGTTRKSIVNVWYCEENTVQYVYGGGRAANSLCNEVNIYGGSIYQAYAGGDGSGAGNPGANVVSDYVGTATDKGNATVNVKGGMVYQVFGGSNTLGMVYGQSSVNIAEAGSCDLLVKDVFGGGNVAPGGNSVVTIPCGAKGLRDVYGGAREAPIEGNVVLNIEGGDMHRVFGGNLQDGTIKGNVTVNVYGSNPGHTIDQVFGGSNAGGNILKAIIVNIDSNQSTCPLQVREVYGGGLNAAYTPTDASKGFPRVNIIQGTVQGDVFGGGLGSGATVTSNPEVNVGFNDNYRAVVGGNVYGGGSQAQVDGNTHVVLRGKNTMVEGNVYGGGNEADVTGSTDVEVGITQEGKADSYRTAE